MYILAKLLFVSYQPEEFTRGMMFRSATTNEVYSLISTRIPIKELIEVYGYPVAPVIVSITANPDDKADIIATSNMIGWWDDGAEYDELRDVTTDDFNYILEEEDGILEIEMDVHDEDHLTPVLYDNKVTIRVARDDEYHDDYEDWDDMDDLTEDDPE